MAESEQQRHIRRGISQWLTGQINLVPGADSWQGGVRLLVLQALRAIDVRFDQLRALMRDRYNIKRDRALIDFYMKGGNAFTVSTEGQLISGGKSDWDTQVVFDAWAPPPVVELLSGLVEDIALDELRQAGIAIANSLNVSKPNLGQDIAAEWLNKRATAVDKVNLSNYTLSLDEPQTVRRIFDHDRLGLWFNAAAPLRDREGDANKKLIPGLVFNDNIKPFVLYRMGFTWHAELVPPDERDGALPQTPIAKPILMELIDVTIPRLNTVEAVEVWDAIASDHITIEKHVVGFDGDLPPRTVELPFPDLYYHLSEQLNMLCEIADGSSRHSDKLLSRFTRLGIVYNSPKVQKTDCEQIMSEQAGVASIVALNKPGAIVVDNRLYDLISGMNVNADVFNAVQGQGEFTVDPANPAYRMGVLVMMDVVRTTAALLRDFTDGELTGPATERLTAARKIDLFRTLPTKGVTQLAFSDDLAYLNELKRLGYLQLNKVGLCGIGSAALGRVRDEEALRQAASGLGANGQYYRTPRENGYSAEYACVQMKDGRPAVMLTLTTATQDELPFVAPAGSGGGGPFFAPLVEMARQRKMAASLIRDYVVRTALSKQYEAGKESILVI